MFVSLYAVFDMNVCYLSLDEEDDESTKLMPVVIALSCAVGVLIIAIVLLILWKNKNKSAIAERGQVRITNYPAYDNKTYMASE